MKYLLILILLFHVGITLSQEVIIIDKDKKTEILFDERNPNSFLKVLELNAGNLGYYNLIGADNEFYSSLNDTQAEQFLRFEGEMSSIPLVDDFGNMMIKNFPDGTQTFVYPAPDSAFICFVGIDRIVFTLNDREGKPYERLNKLQLWKRYDGELHRVLTMDAAQFMTFEGATIISTLSSYEKDEIMGKDGNPSLWSTMRDSSLSEMKWFQDRSKDGVYNGSAGTSVQTIFPLSWFDAYVPNSSYVNSLYRAKYEIEFNGYFDYDKIYPFARGMTDSIFDGTMEHDEVLKNFETVHSIKTQYPYPLRDDYGDNIIRIDENGIEHFVYEEAYEDYFFLDYQPTILISKRVICDSLNNCKLTPTGLLFCKENGSPNPSIISTFQFYYDDAQSPKSQYKSYIENFASEDLWQIPQFFVLREIINKKKYRKTLTLEESTIPCVPCVNKKGRYALCWRGKAVTPYHFDSIPYDRFDGTFQARKGDLLYLLDTKGKTLVAEELDEIHMFNNHPGVYLFEKDNLWKIYDRNKEFKSPWIALESGYSYFNVDMGSYTYLDKFTMITANKKGLKGLIDTRGNTLIVHQFNDLYELSCYDYDDHMVWTQLGTAIGRIGTTNTWQVFDAEHQPSFTLEGEEFLASHGKYIMVRRGGIAHVFDAGTGSEKTEFITEDNHLMLDRENISGVVDSTWKIIVPFKFRTIERVVTEAGIYFFCSGDDKGGYIYDLSGNVINSFETYTLMRRVCSSLAGFYRIEENDLKGILYFNADLQNFEVLFEPQFTSIFCQSLDPEMPFGRAFIQTGNSYVFYHLYQDGRMEVVKK